MTDYYDVTLLDGVLGMDSPERRVLRFKEDSSGGTFYTQFYDVNGGKVDLSGGTVTFRYRTPAGTINTTIATLTVESATDGKAYWLMGTASVPTSGAFVSEFRLDAGVKSLRSDNISMVVAPTLPST